MTESKNKKQARWLPVLRVLSLYERGIRVIAAVILVMVYVIWGHSYLAASAVNATLDMKRELLTNATALNEGGNDLQASVPARHPTSAPDANSPGSKSSPAVQASPSATQPASAPKEGSQNSSPAAAASNTGTGAKSVSPLLVLPVYFLNLAIPVGFVLIAVLALVGNSKSSDNESGKRNRSLGWIWIAGVIGVSIPLLVTLFAKTV